MAGVRRNNFIETTMVSATQTRACCDDDASQSLSKSAREKSFGSLLSVRD